MLRAPPTRVLARREEGERFSLPANHDLAPVAALALDVHGYVRKPVSKDSLVKAIHRAFNRTIALKPPEDYTAIALPEQV